MRGCSRSKLGRSSLERDDLAVEHHLGRAERRPERAELGIPMRDVVAAAALQADSTTLDVCQRADAVPLDLERPCVVVPGQLVAEGGEHRLEVLRHWFTGRIGRRVHAMDHPVVAIGLEQRVATLHALAVQHHDDLIGAELLGGVGAAIPDRHRARAVLTLRDVALELEVLERVILGVHRAVVAARIRRDALGNGPRRECAVTFEA
jgi:hypothetical protein